ncbi:SMODS domain-containing nucleotidyltransferase [Streptomyces sp. st140]|uniref:SMODS domain-containing nucleotidyltransferase n=1 Tax=Streptomyces sp. st140 TaxID=1828052 RepID=UPI0035A116E3
MNSTLEKTFEIFVRRISLSQQQIDEARERAEEICRFLSRADMVQECKMTGSMARSTAIQEFSDIDVVAVLGRQPPSGATPHSITAGLLKTVKPRYRQAQISDNTVRIRFARGLDVDVIPAIPDFGNPRSGIFKIPSADREQWDTYDPEERNQAINRKSALLGAEFIHLIQIIKWWSKRNGQPIPSYEIENIASSAFCSRMPPITRAIVDFFELAEFSSGIRLKHHVNLISVARAIGNAALRCEERGDTRGALNHWGSLLGDQFSSVVS